MNRKTRPFYKKEEYAMRKITRYFLIIAIPIVLVVVCITAPWAYMYLYGKYVVAEPPKPEIVNESFPFTLVYKLEGKKKVIKDTMICQYTGSEWDGEDDVQSRTWDVKLKSGEHEIVLWEGVTSSGDRQRIICGVEPEYYMGDVADDRMQLEIDETNLISGMTEEEFYYSYLLLQTMDSDDGIEEETIDKKELLSKYQIEILSWECRKPIKNKFE